jgi:protein-export chaperone SecB
MTTTGNGGPTQTPAGAPTQPQLNVLGQYIKDFSFENPNAPSSLTPTQTQPAIQIQINVGVQQLAETDYEVSLKLDGKADSSGSVLFAFDLTFAGVFRIQNVPQELAADNHDRVSAAPAVRARDRGNLGAQWLSAPPSSTPSILVSLYQQRWHKCSRGKPRLPGVKGFM